MTMEVMFLLSLFLQPSDDDTISLHSQVSESTREQTLRNDNHLIGNKHDSQKGKACGTCVVVMCLNSCLVRAQIISVKYFRIWHDGVVHLYVYHFKHHCNKMIKIKSAYAQ